MIDNPSQRNALTKAMCIELGELMPRLDADPTVTVITLRGVGDAFSAGATINDLRSVILDGDDGGVPVDHLSLADNAIASVAGPTVALVDGICMGGGWEIASACDFILASDRSKFAVTPAKIGVIYPRAGVERLIRQVGPALAKLILFTGDTFSAAEAQDIGLVARVYPAGEFDDRTAALVASLLERSQFSIHTMKRLVDLTATADSALDRAWTDAWDAFAGSPDLQLGIDAFLGRTQPTFRWRPERQEER